MQVHNTIPAKRISDGFDVFLKEVPWLRRGFPFAPPESVLEYMAGGPSPLLFDQVEIEEEGRAIKVFQLLRPYSRTPFTTVDEIADMMLQTMRVRLKMLAIPYAECIHQGIRTLHSHKRSLQWWVTNSESIQARLKGDYQV